MVYAKLCLWLRRGHFALQVALRDLFERVDGDLIAHVLDDNSQHTWRRALLRLLRRRRLFDAVYRLLKLLLMLLMMLLNRLDSLYDRILPYLNTVHFHFEL